MQENHPDRESYDLIWEKIISSEIHNYQMKYVDCIETIPNLQEEIDKADDKEIKEDRITALANELHPGMIIGVVKSIEKETKDSKRITFTSPQIPYFSAGNYLIVQVKIGDTNTSRAYSIITSPLKAHKEKERARVRTGARAHTHIPPGLNENSSQPGLTGKAAVFLF